VSYVVVVNLGGQCLRRDLLYSEVHGTGGAHSKDVEQQAGLAIASLPFILPGWVAAYRQAISSQNHSKYIYIFRNT
jgi:hypothetical protein